MYNVKRIIEQLKTYELCPILEKGRKRTLNVLLEQLIKNGYSYISTKYTYLLIVLSALDQDSSEENITFYTNSFINHIKSHPSSKQVDSALHRLLDGIKVIKLTIPSVKWVVPTIYPKGYSLMSAWTTEVSVTSSVIPDSDLKKIIKESLFPKSSPATQPVNKKRRLIRPQNKTKQPQKTSSTSSSVMQQSNTKPVVFNYANNHNDTGYDHEKFWAPTIYSKLDPLTNPPEEDEQSQKTTVQMPRPSPH